MNVIGKAFAFTGVVCLALALTAGVIANLCFEIAADNETIEHA